MAVDKTFPVSMWQFFYYIDLSYLSCTPPIQNNLLSISGSTVVGFSQPVYNLRERENPYSLVVNLSKGNSLPQSLSLGVRAMPMTACKELLRSIFCVSVMSELSRLLLVILLSKFTSLSLFTELQ